MDEFASQESFREMAKMGLAIYRGLKEDGANDVEAYVVLSSMFAGMMSSVNPLKDTEGHG